MSTILLHFKESGIGTDSVLCSGSHTKDDMRLLPVNPYSERGPCPMLEDGRMNAHLYVLLKNKNFRFFFMICALF